MTTSVSDPQTQMMLMLADLFSKFSVHLEIKSLESKTEWPCSTGDSKKCCVWYLSIMEQLSIPPCLELYSPTTNDIIDTTTNFSLNGKLHA